MTERLHGLPVRERLIPFVQVHEFEAILFSDPSCFRYQFPESSDAIGKLHVIRARFESPEHIDDGPATVPSKRILDLFPDYEKPVAGMLIAQRIGLAAIRRECLHFGEWFDTLISLDKS